jgi:hypothetical protein
MLRRVAWFTHISPIVTSGTTGPKRENIRFFRQVGASKRLSLVDRADEHGWYIIFSQPTWL